MTPYHYKKKLQSDKKMPLGNATTIKLLKKLRYYDSGKKTQKR